MISRRNFAAIGAGGVIASLAGCAELVAGDGAVEFTAEFAAPDDEAVERAGFEEAFVERGDLEDTVGLGDIERDLRATYWVATYTRPIDATDAGIETASFTAVSTPTVDVLGEERNPLADVDNETLIEEFARHVGSVEEVRHRDAYSLALLGADRTVDVAHATATAEGVRVELAVELATFVHEEDVLVLLGGHPRRLGHDVEYDALMAAVEHPTAPPDDVARVADDD